MRKQNGYQYLSIEVVHPPLLATTAVMNFQLTDGPSIDIRINLDVFKPEIPL